MIEDITKTRTIELTECELTHLYHLMQMVSGHPDNTGRGVTDSVGRKIHAMIDEGDEDEGVEWRDENMNGSIYFNGISPIFRFND